MDFSDRLLGEAIELPMVIRFEMADLIDRATGGANLKIIALWRAPLPQKLFDLMELIEVHKPEWAFIPFIAAVCFYPLEFCGHRDFSHYMNWVGSARLPNCHFLWGEFFYFDNLAGKEPLAFHLTGAISTLVRVSISRFCR